MKQPNNPTNPTKAFIFDMDGVIIDSETIWQKYDKQLLSELIGEKIYKKIKDNVMGSTINTIYDLACQNGFTINKKLFIQKYDEKALTVYAQAEITKDIDTLLQKLKTLNFKTAIVSASRQLWINQVLTRLKNPDTFDYILSLSDRQDLKPKPSPDGYLEAIQKLNSTPQNTIILEDSNRGLQSAKATGALTLCLREHLPPGYISQGADLYVNNINEIITSNILLAHVTQKLTP